VTYRVSEAYALIGSGGAGEAVALLQDIHEIPLPRYLSARVQCLASLAALMATSQSDATALLPKEALALAIGTLRKLEWPGVMPLLPHEMGRIFCMALEQGIEVQWVRAAIRRRALPAPSDAPESWPWPIIIRVMGRFELTVEAAQALGRDGDRRKAASKQLELLRFLASNGAEPVPADSIALELWPGDGREGRRKALEVTVARLRRLLGSDAAVLVRDQSIGLNRELVWVDVQALHERLQEFEAAEDANASAFRALDAAVALYRGACLAQSPHCWAPAAATRWRMRLASALMRLRDAPGEAGMRGKGLVLRVTSSDREMANYLHGTG
jgi:hypothetical protein